MLISQVTAGAAGGWGSLACAAAVLWTARFLAGAAMPARGLPATRVLPPGPTPPAGPSIHLRVPAQPPAGACPQVLEPPGVPNPRPRAYTFFLSGARAPGGWGDHPADRRPGGGPQHGPLPAEDLLQDSLPHGQLLQVGGGAGGPAAGGLPGRLGLWQVRPVQGGTQCCMCWGGTQCCMRGGEDSATYAGGTQCCMY